MTIAIASGKGGTGKTTIAVALAFAAPGPVRLLDCDVEAPNCHIFLKPEISAWEPVGIPIPVVDKAKCTACGACSGICQYHAIVVMKTQPLVFPEMCHGCGGCAKVCPTGAISEVSREMGVVESGRHGAIEFVQGGCRWAIQWRRRSSARSNAIRQAMPLSSLTARPEHHAP